MSVSCAQWLLLPHHRQGQREGHVPKCRSSSPLGLVLAGSLPFKIMVSTLLSIAPSPQGEGGSTGAEGARTVLFCGPGWTPPVLACQSELKTVSYPPPVPVLPVTSLLFHDSLPGVSKLCFPQLHSPQQQEPLPSQGSGATEYGAGAQHIWACTEVVTGNWPKPRKLHSASSSLFQGVIKHVHSLQERILGFLQSSYKSHWVSSQLRGLVFPVSNLRTGFPITWFQLLSLQGGSLRPCDPPPFLCSLRGVRVLI